MRMVADAAVFVRRLMVSLPLHPAVLEPGLHLLFGQLDDVGDLDTAMSAEVAVEMKLLLQFQRLPATVRRSRSPAMHAWLLQQLMLTFMVMRKMMMLMMRAKMLRRLTAA